MNWREYFNDNNGDGYLATADVGGEVNIAPYFRPEVLGDGSLAFGMSNGRTYRNVKQNGHATFAFNEGAHRGVRLYLEKTEEVDKGLVLEKLRARADAEVLPGTGRHLEHVVVFRVTRHEPLTNV
ncbi:MAG: pyridoxamine 5'-phosphate oxidase family protein [bacterium]